MIKQKSWKMSSKSGEKKINKSLKQVKANFEKIETNWKTFLFKTASQISRKQKKNSRKIKYKLFLFKNNMMRQFYCTALYKRKIRTGTYFCLLPFSLHFCGIFFVYLRNPAGSASYPVFANPDPGGLHA